MEDLQLKHYLLTILFVFVGILSFLLGAKIEKARLTASLDQLCYTQARRNGWVIANEPAPPGWDATQVPPRDGALNR